MTEAQQGSFYDASFYQTSVERYDITMVPIAGQKVIVNIFDLHESCYALVVELPFEGDLKPLTEMINGLLDQYERGSITRVDMSDIDNSDISELLEDGDGEKDLA